MAGNGHPMQKSYPVFDCDAHVNDPLGIWEHVEPEYRDLVRQAYWRDDSGAILNGEFPVMGGENRAFHPSYNSICISGPGMSKEVKRKLLFTPLNDEQRDYLDHKGAYDPHERVKDLDLMGIDQVMIIPTMMVEFFRFINNADGAYALSRAYNDWAEEFCQAVPDRLFFAGWLPLQNASYSAQELHRLVKKGSRVALVRPTDAKGNYPSQINFSINSTANWDEVFRTFEETGIVCGMHTFPSQGPGFDGRNTMNSPGQLVDMAGHGAGISQGLTSETLSFVYEATAWLTQVLLSGFLDRYPKLKMAIFESNATWLPGVLERLDRYFDLYANERRVPAKRRPTEAFYEQCFISFESDEVPVFRQWDRFENVGIWASDCYHHDGADSWSAMRFMNEVEVPEAVQARLLGGNALSMYNIEPKMFVTEEQPIIRPDWFPKQEEVEAFMQQQKDVASGAQFAAHTVPGYFTSS